MRVLLLTRNHVVREFMELVTGRIAADLEVREDAGETDRDAYDFLFVDDRGRLLEEGVTLLERMKINQSIVLFNEDNALHALFDQKIKKPFLPSDIQSVLEADPAEKNQTEETLSAEEQVLNIQDIEEIRGLLEAEGMEIVSEEELADEIEMHDSTPTQEADVSTEEKLLAAISSMNPKKIRKLLKGAEVTLTIRFPKEIE